MRDAPLFRTMAALPDDVRRAAWRTIFDIESDHPNLPAPGDEEYLVPPMARRWRRRVGATSWWVVYSFSTTTQALVLRTVNLIP